MPGVPQLVPWALLWEQRAAPRPPPRSLPTPSHRPESGLSGKSKKKKPTPSFPSAEDEMLPGPRRSRACCHHLSSPPPCVTLALLGACCGACSHPRPRARRLHQPEQPQRLEIHISPVFDADRWEISTDDERFWGDLPLLRAAGRMGVPGCSRHGEEGRGGGAEPTGRISRAFVIGADI